MSCVSTSRRCSSHTSGRGLFSSGRPLIGRTLANYRIVSRLGAGGMGEVYKAHDSKLERDVALKLLPRDVDADRLRRFDAEARTVSSLNHPHIVVIHDFGNLDGRPFIITELVEGETLRQRLTRLCRLVRPSRSPRKSPARWWRRMRERSSIATSSRKT
jgi:serine/threonine protein kinase